MLDMQVGLNTGAAQVAMQGHGVGQEEIDSVSRHVAKRGARACAPARDEGGRAHAFDFVPAGQHGRSMLMRRSLVRFRHHGGQLLAGF